MATYTEGFDYASEAAYEAVWTNVQKTAVTTTFPSSKIRYGLSLPTFNATARRQDTKILPGTSTGSATASSVAFVSATGSGTDRDTDFIFSIQSTNGQYYIQFRAMQRVIGGNPSFMYTATTNAISGLVTGSVSNQSNGTGVLDLFITKTGTVLTLGSTQHGTLFTRTWPFTSEALNKAHTSGGGNNRSNVTSFAVEVASVSFDYTGGRTTYIPNLTGSFVGDKSKFAPPRIR